AKKTLWHYICSTVFSGSYVDGPGGSLETLSTSSFSARSRCFLGLGLGRWHRSEGNYSEGFRRHPNYPNEPKPYVCRYRHPEFALPHAVGCLRVPSFPESDWPDGAQLDDRDQ